MINYPFESEKQNADKILQSLEGSAKAIIVEADHSTTSGPSQMVEVTFTEFGSIDILVNNAGISGPSFLDLDDESILRNWDSIMNLNS